MNSIDLSKEMKDAKCARLNARIAAVYEIQSNCQSQWGKLYWDNVLAYLLRQANRLN